jgi:8-oxo-(d)GTP phosphatase
VSSPHDDVLAAGAVLWRSVGQGVEVAPRSPGSLPPGVSGGPAEGHRLTIAVVHRPRYDDWSLPKGKLDADESMAAAAVREVREETGVAARLGPWLCDVRYAVSEGRKLVRYWSAEARTAPEFVPNHETDALRWVPPDVATDLLTYAHDAEVVARFAELGPPTSVLLLVRHAKAGSRDEWDGDDELRPLSEAGRRQAHELGGLLRLYGPDRICTAPPLRCRDSVVPLADALGLPVVDEPLLSEGVFEKDPDATLARVRELAALPGVTVASSQGGVIPDAVAALARDAAPPVAVDLNDVPSKKASTWVLSSRDGKLVAADYVERPDGR